MKVVLGVLLAVVTLMVASVVVNPIERLHAQVVQPLIPASDYVTLGMVGIAAGQTARLNALMLPVGGPIIAGGSCQVTLAFLDDRGDTLASTTLPMTQNQAVHFDYPAPASVGASPVEIRGTVEPAFVIKAGTVASVPGRCPVVPSMEIYNSSNGQTTILLTQSHVLPQVIPLTAAP